MPQPNNSAPYPNQGGYPNQGMYPSQQQAQYPPNPGYPNQVGFCAQPSYPNNAPYSHQQSSIPFGAGFPQLPPSQANTYSSSMPAPSSQQFYPPAQPGFQSNYNTSQTPAMPSYPPQTPAMPSYPPQTNAMSSYPPQTHAMSNYPPQTPAMPNYQSQSVYQTPSSTHNAYPSHTQYPSNQTSFASSQGYPALPNSGYQQPSQHISATNMAACFSEMQSHNRHHTKSKVCLRQIYFGTFLEDFCVCVSMFLRCYNIFLEGNFRCLNSERFSFHF